MISNSKFASYYLGTIFAVLLLIGFIPRYGFGSRSV